MPSPAFSFATHAADPRLQPWIRGSWEFSASEGAPAAHHVPPDGSAFLVLVEVNPAEPQILTFGPRITPLVIPTTPGVRYRGLRFAPEAAPLLLGVPAATLIQQPVNTSHVGPVPAAAVIAALRAGPLAAVADAIDQLFLPVLDRLPNPDRQVAEALFLIRFSRGEISVKQTAGCIGVTPRTLLRRVRGATGLTPKQHARIARFSAAARAMLDPDHRLSHLAAKGGYADQPHFHHEVTALTGLTPAQLAERVQSTEHRLGE